MQMFNEKLRLKKPQFLLSLHIIMLIYTVNY